MSRIRGGSSEGVTMSVEGEWLLCPICRAYRTRDPEKLEEHKGKHEGYSALWSKPPEEYHAIKNVYFKPSSGKIVVITEEGDIIEL